MPLFGVHGERIGYTIFPHRKHAPPLLLLHGFTASSASFATNLPELRKQFTVITVDLLGHGASDAPEDVEAYAPERAIERIAELMDHLDIDQALLCGHSLGGALALRVALDHPDRVAGLVLINSNSAAGTAEWRREVQPGLATMAARVRAEGTGFLKQTRLYPAQSRRLPEDARALLTDDFDRLTPAGVAGTAEGLVARVNAFERIPELAVATLVVIGDRDADFVRNAPGLLAAIRPPFGRAVTLAGAGHAANLEQPEAFNEALSGFAHDIGYLENGDDGNRANGWLVLAGAGFVALGAALLGASFIIGDVNDATQATGSPSRTSVNEVAGARASATARMVASPSPSNAAVAGADLSATPTATATATDTPTEAPTEEREEPTPVPPTPTPEPATPTATPTEPASPTPTPTTDPSTLTGASVTVYGPDRLGVGEPGAFWVQITPPEDGRLLTWDWDRGDRARPQVAYTFPEAGCHTISVVAYFSNERTLAGSKQVVVGTATCEE